MADRRMAPGDAELMRRWQAGDTSAFEEIVRRWQGRIGRLLARLAGPSAAPDLCQEVFLRLYRAGTHYREESAFTTWIYRIALNVARDAARRRRHCSELGNNEPLDNTTPHDDLDRRETIELVSAALDQLPDYLREVLVLRHYESMSFEDMSRLLHVPASTLKSRFSAAVDRLRLRLEELGCRPEENAS
jgi:RNA polymerase sigma-70 factor (ECF subfamily)